MRRSLHAAAVVAEFQHFGNGVLINGVDANHIVFQVAGDGTVTATDFVNTSSAR